MTIRILIVDDDQNVLEDLKTDLPDHLSDLGEIEVVPVNSFDTAQQLLESFDKYFDVVVLDVRQEDAGVEGETRGAKLYERVRSVRWLPVVFYTGVPQECEGLAAPPLVDVVVKDKPEELYVAVRAAIDSGAASLARRLLKKVDSNLRSFLGQVVAPNWAEYSALGSDELEGVLLTRLAAWLREWGDETNGMLQPIGHTTTVAAYYLQPPVSQTGLRAGSILVDDAKEIWVVLTPTCDLFTNEAILKIGEEVRSPKADRVFLAKGMPARDHPKILKYLAGPSNTTTPSAIKIVTNHADNARWFYLPGFLNVPELIVDMEWVTSAPIADVSKWERLADLDQPFAEALLARHASWRGRIGTPDLDATESLRRLSTS